MTTTKTGRAEFEAERDAMKAAAEEARLNLTRSFAGDRAWHRRLGELLDALEGVELGHADQQFLAWLARSDAGAAAAVSLIGRIKRGAYPDIQAELEQERAAAEQLRLDADHARDRAHRPETPAQDGYQRDPVDEA